MAYRNVLNFLLYTCLILNFNNYHLSKPEVKIEHFTNNIGLIPFDEEHLALTEIVVEDCNLIDCPTHHGTCKNHNLCKCNNGYLDVSRIPRLNKEYSLKFGNYCNYEQKQQIIALVFEVFFPIGLGHFYLRRTAVGLIKMVVGIISYLCFLQGLETNKKLNFYLYFIIASTYFVFHVFDLVLIGMNYYLDGNGLRVKSL